MLAACAPLGMGIVQVATTGDVHGTDAGILWTALAVVAFAGHDAGWRTVAWAPTAFLAVALLVGLFQQYVAGAVLDRLHRPGAGTSGE